MLLAGPLGSQDLQITQSNIGIIQGTPNKYSTVWRAAYLCSSGTTTFSFGHSRQVNLGPCVVRGPVDGCFLV
jgi:hypothetical protein